MIPSIILVKINEIIDVNCLAKCLAYSRCSKFATVTITTEGFTQALVLKIWFSQSVTIAASPGNLSEM